jgi:DNA-binding Xre family transcriptional regulator
MKILRVDEKRLDLAMASAGIRQYEDLADAAKISSQTIRNIRKDGICSMNVLASLADALNCNPIDLIVTPGFPDPKLEALAALSA